MEQRNGMRYVLREQAWQRLTGKRILLAGLPGEQRQIFTENLGSIGSLPESGFSVAEGLEHGTKGDYVILFGVPETAEPGATGTGKMPGSRNEGQTEAMEPGAAMEGRPGTTETDAWKEKQVNTAGGSRNTGSNPESEGTSGRNGGTRRSWERSPAIWEASEHAWKATLGLLEELKHVSHIQPSSILLVTDNEVYGTCFGEERPRREEELGYACHTDGRGTHIQCMRMAEHMACRFAREEGLPVKVARLGELSPGKGISEVLELAVRVLLDGENGEVYNLAGTDLEIRRPENRSGENVAEAGAGERTIDSIETETAKRTSGSAAGMHSPLTPISVRTDTGKAEKLGE